MIRKLILSAIFAIGLASPALAQNTQCSDRPSADSSNACANTRFVHGYIPAIPYTNITGVPANTFLGNSTGVTANANAFNGTQATSMLDVFTSTLKGVVPASGGGTTNFLRADGQWVAAGTNVYTPPGTGAVATTVQNELRRMVWIKDYGAVCDGVTDDTTAIQNAWNYAASVNLDVWLGGVGPTCKISSLTMPAPVAIGLGSSFGAARASMLHGPSANQVILLSTVTGTSCAISISGIYGITSSLEGKFSGFGVSQITQTSVGNGICLSNITKATFDDVSISYFNIGFNADDTILLNIEKSWFEFNSIHISGQQVSNTGPNGWNIGDNHFSNAVLFGIRLTAPNLVNIIGNDFESNGIPSGTSAITVFVTAPPIPNAVGVNFNNNYVEGNAGTELWFTGSAAYQTVYNVKGNLFTRSVANSTNGVVINNNATAGSSYTVVNFGGNSFFEAITPSTFKMLLAVNGATLNYTFNCAESNYGNFTTEINSICSGVRVPGGTIKADANGQFIGLQ